MANGSPYYAMMGIINPNYQSQIDTAQQTLAANQALGGVVTPQNVGQAYNQWGTGIGQAALTGQQIGTTYGYNPAQIAGFNALTSAAPIESSLIGHATNPWQLNPAGAQAQQDIYARQAQAAGLLGQQGVEQLATMRELGNTPVQVSQATPVQQAMAGLNYIQAANQLNQLPSNMLSAAEAQLPSDATYEQKIQRAKDMSLNMLGGNHHANEAIWQGVEPDPQAQKVAEQNNQQYGLPTDYNSTLLGNKQKMAQYTGQMQMEQNNITTLMAAKQNADTFAGIAPKGLTAASPALSTLFQGLGQNISVNQTPQGTYQLTQNNQPLKYSAAGDVIKAALVGSGANIGPNGEPLDIDVSKAITQDKDGNTIISGNISSLGREMGQVLNNRIATAVLASPLGQQFLDHYATSGVKPGLNTSNVHPAQFNAAAGKAVRELTNLHDGIVSKTGLNDNQVWALMNSSKNQQELQAQIAQTKAALGSPQGQ